MAWLVKKEDYKIGERYTSFLIYWFIFYALVRAFTGRFTGNNVGNAADSLVVWTGMPDGLAEVLGILIVGTLTFPLVLLFQLWEVHNKRKSELPEATQRKTNQAAFHVGRFIGWIFSKRKRP